MRRLWEVEQLFPKMSTLSMVKVLKALKPGERFNKMYYYGDRMFRLRIGKHDLFIALPYAIFPLTLALPEAQQHSLVQFVRKRLKNRRLVHCGLLGFDRTLFFKFDGDVSLVFEFVGKGNVLVLEKGEVVMALEYGEWSTRAIKRGTRYVPPPNPFSAFFNWSADRYVISAMKALNLGTQAHKHVLKLCGIDERKVVSALTQEEWQCLKRAVHEVIERWDEDFGVYNEVLRQQFVEEDKEDRRVRYQREALEKFKQELKTLEAHVQFLQQRYDVVEHFLSTYKRVGINALESVLRQQGFNVRVDKAKRLLYWVIE